MWVYHANPAPAAHKIENSHGSQASEETQPTNASATRATASEYISSRRAATTQSGKDAKLPFHIILPNGKALVGAPVTSIRCLPSNSEKKQQSDPTPAALGAGQRTPAPMPETALEDAEELYQLDFQSSHFTWTWRARYLVLSLSEFYSDRQHHASRLQQWGQRLSFCGCLLLLLQCIDFGLIIANAVALGSYSAAANAARMVTLRTLYPQYADWLPPVLFAILPCIYFRSFSCKSDTSLMVIQFLLFHDPNSSLIAAWWP